jgi:hypothetical protein
MKQAGQIVIFKFPQTIGEISKERFIRIRENLSHWIRTGKVNAALSDEN